MRTRLLTFLMLLLASAMPASAYDFMVNGLAYNKNSDGTSVTVTYQNSNWNPSYTSLSGALNIPSSVTYSGKTYSVTAIGEWAFCHCENMTSVTIPTSVTSIGGAAFAACHGLTRVNYNNLVGWCNIDFGDDEWSNPLFFAKNLYINGSKVTNLTIPNSITNIKRFTFAGFSSMTKLTIPNTVKTIGSGAFENCTGLTTVTIPNSVTDIGWNAFGECSGLTSLTIGSSVKTIQNKAFTYCSGLTSVTIPNSVTSLGEQAFSNCSGLTSLTIGSGVTSIAWLAFYKCNNLSTVYWNATNCPDFTDSSHAPFNGLTSVKSMVIGNNVTKIPDYLCYNLTGLTSVTIGNSVTSIGGNAFNGCTGLTKVDINDLAAWCNIDFTSSNNNPLYYGKNLYLNGTKVTNLSIPNSVKTIKGYAFYNCTSITKVTIPSGVTTVGGWAFRNCTNLTTVNWNAANCADCGDSSRPFYGSNNIQSFIFGNTVIRIPKYLCCSMSGLTSVTIPSSVTSIGHMAFGLCNNLNKVEISNLAKWCNIDFEDNTANPLNYGKNLYLNGTKVTNLTIPNTVTKIKDYTFYNCTSLTSVTFPNSVTKIGNYAFYGCSNLPSIEIPNTVNSVGQSAFAGCSSMSLLTIPNSVTSLGSGAFNSCSGLTAIRSKLTAPQSVTYGASIFNGVPKNTCTVYVPLNTRSSYLSSSQWNTFTRIIEVDYEIIEQLDVDGDGWVTSSDVTMLYNHILNDSGTDFPEGDVDGDGYVTAADITAIYNMLLGL